MHIAGIQLLTSTWLQCSNVNPDGVECSYFRWGSSSPSSSPTLPQSTATYLAPTQTATQIAVNLAGCTFSGCGTARLAPACSTRMCRRHCLQLGTCAMPSHRKPNDSQSTSAPTPATTTYPPSGSTLSTLPPTPSISLTVSSTPTSSTTLQTLDARPHPVHPSHIAPVFTQSWEVQQTLYNSKRERDAEMLENSRRAMAQVTVHAQVTVRAHQIMSSHNIDHAYRTTKSPPSPRSRTASWCHTSS